MKVETLTYGHRLKYNIEGNFGHEVTGLVFTNDDGSIIIDARFGESNTYKCNRHKLYEIKEQNPIKRIVFMNAAIATSTGRYEKTGPCDAEYIQKFLKRNIDIPRVSAVGHEASAVVMTELCGEKVEVNRCNHRHEPGDISIIVTLKNRIPEGEVLTREMMEKIGYDIYMMEMIYCL